MFKKADFSRLQRWLSILVVLLEEERTVAYFSDRLGVSEKTIRRDISGLESCYIPVYVERNICKIGPLAPALKKLVVSQKDCTLEQSFFRQFFEAERGHEWLQRRLMPFAAGQFDIQPWFSGCDIGFFCLVQKALQERLWIDISYYKPSQDCVVSRRIAALKVYFRKHGWYLQAFSEYSGKVNVFRLNRIREVVITDDLFERNEWECAALDSGLGAFQGAPERVLLKFAEAAVPFVREIQWHHSQKWFDKQPGLLELRCSIDYDLEQWILGYGAECMVLEPLHLREKIKSLLKAALGQYS